MAKPNTVEQFKTYQKRLWHFSNDLSVISSSSNTFNPENNTYINKAVGEIKDIHEDLQKKISSRRNLLPKQTECEKLKHFVDEGTQKVENLVNRIYNLSTEVEDLLNEVKDLKENEICVERIDEIVSHSKKLSYSTAAPYKWNFDKNLDLPVPFKLPFPTEENMKQGILFTDVKILENNLHNYNMAKEKESHAGDEEVKLPYEMFEEDELKHIKKLKSEQSINVGDEGEKEAFEASNFNLLKIESEVNEGNDQRYTNVLGSPVPQITSLRKLKKRDAAFDLDLSSDSDNDSDE